MEDLAPTTANDILVRLDELFFDVSPVPTFARSCLLSLRTLALAMSHDQITNTERILQMLDRRYI